MSVRSILKSMAKRGHEVKVLGTTVFDDLKGTTILKPHWDTLQGIESGQSFEVNDDPIRHILVKTESTDRSKVNSEELVKWTIRYRQELKYFQPDIVFFYGGGPGDFIPAEARSLGIPRAAYVVNGSYHSKRWARDVTTFITDTNSTAQLYQHRLNINPFVAGKFIEQDKISERRTPKNLLFVNPNLAKGGGVLIMLARELEKLLPDFKIDVVLSRGNWEALLGSVNQATGFPISDHPGNIILHENLADMRGVYANAKFLFVPSLWWESGARVIAEAQLNSVPVIATNYGGNPEMVGRGGILFDLPNTCHQEPFLEMPSWDIVTAIAKQIKFYQDNDDKYAALSAQAINHAREKYLIGDNAAKLERHFIEVIRDFSNKITTVAYEPYRGTAAEQVDSVKIRKRFEKGIFLDCGGNDGCSAIKFLAENHKFDVVSFEPNPAMWQHYEELSVTLAKCAVSNLNGESSFIIDSIDGDGSTLLNEKKVDWTGRLDNSAFSSIDVQTCDIAEIIDACNEYDTVILKLDVEGAEYSILKRLLQTGKLNKVDMLYIEWHWNKIGMNEQAHLAFKKDVQSCVECREWDALEFGVLTEEKLAERKDFLDEFNIREMGRVSSNQLKKYLAQYE